MSNRYINKIRRDAYRAGSMGILDDLASAISGGKSSSASELVSTVRKGTKKQKKRLNKIALLSEVNMELLGADLVLLDQTLRIYNAVGYAAFSAAALGSILLGMKTYSRIKGDRDERFR